MYTLNRSIYIYIYTPTSRSSRSALINEVRRTKSRNEWTPSISVLRTSTLHVTSGDTVILQVVLLMHKFIHVCTILVELQLTND